MYANVVVTRLGHSELVVLVCDESLGSDICRRKNLCACSQCLGGVLLGSLHLDALRIAGHLGMGSDAESILLAGHELDGGRDEPVVASVGLAVGVACQAAVPVPGTAVLVGIDNLELLLVSRGVEAVDVGQRLYDGRSGLLGINGQRLNVAQIVHAVLGSVEHDELSCIERERLGLAVVGHGEVLQVAALWIGTHSPDGHGIVIHADELELAEGDGSAVEGTLDPGVGEVGRQSADVHLVPYEGHLHGGRNG